MTPTLEAEAPIPASGVLDTDADGATATASGAPPRRSVRSVMTRLTARRAARSGAVLGVVVAVYSGIQALGYVDTYKTQASRQALASTLNSSSGLTALVGPGHDLQTVAGYTEWKCFMMLVLVVGVWGLLTGTRLLRGEEEAGRWEILLAGRTNRRRATASALAGLGLGLAALFTVASLGTVLAWRSHRIGIAPSAAVFFVLAVSCSAAVFLALGALASEIAPTRRQAATYAGGALGLSFVVRMVADTNQSLTWLRWASPLGWIEQLHPLSAPDPRPLVVVAVFVGLCATLTVWLAGRRDLGASITPDRPTARPHTRLLRSPLGLGARLARPTVLAWMAGVALLALILASETNAATKSLEESTGAKEVLTRLGGGGAAVEAYLGVCFFILAVVVALEAVGHVTAARHEEALERLDHLLVRPVSRARWLCGRLAIAVGSIVATALVAGLCVWAAAAGQHTGVSGISLLEAAVNVVPPALCFLGLGVLVFGVAPRLTSVAVYAFLAWSFLVELIGGILQSNGWVFDTSPFHQMAAAPAVPPDWVSGAAMIAVGGVAAALGVVALARRDLAGE